MKEKDISPVWLVLKKDLEIPAELSEKLVKKANDKGEISTATIKKICFNENRLIDLIKKEMKQMVYFKTWEK